MKCKNCGSSESEVDPARGVSHCTGCGAVVENNQIVSELSFSTAGAHGYFLNSNRGQGALMGGRKVPHH